MKTYGLTARQLTVTRLIADCLRVKQIAYALNISEQAVHEHIDHIVLIWELDPTKDARTQIALSYRQRSTATAA